MSITVVILIAGVVAYVIGFVARDWWVLLALGLAWVVLRGFRSRARA